MSFLPAVSSAGVTSFRSSTFTTTAPLSVLIGSLTAPAGSVKATASTAGLTPTSAIGAPRAIRSVVFASRPAAFAAASKSPGFELRRDRRRALAGRIRRLSLDHVVPDPRLDFVEGRQPLGLRAGQRDEREALRRANRLAGFPLLHLEGALGHRGRHAEAGDRLVPGEGRRFADREPPGLADGVEIAGIVDLLVELVGQPLRLVLGALPLQLVLDLRLDLVERPRGLRLVVGRLDDVQPEASSSRCR